MSVTSGFFNSLSGDRKYDAIQISSMFDGLITDGIYNGFLESFMVTASSPASMVVTVGEGRCWFNHTWTLNDAPLPLTLDVGDVVLNRIDTIVIDVDSTDAVRACTIKIIKGTPSSQAVRPTLENTETHHQYPLCDISVVAGATTITQSNITNRRGTSDCPFVATLMKSVNVDDLLVQWESQWNDWMTDRANSMDSWTAEQQEAFTTWFQTVQDILDENTAGNLLNRINHRTGINATATYSAGVVAITAPDDAGEILTFVAPSDFLSSDTYTLNGEALTITDLNGEALDEAWKKSSPVTITVSGGKAFFKAGGSGKNDTLPPLLGNMTVEVVEGDENDTYTIKMDKLILDKTTEMVGGAQLEWGEEMPAKPGKGTGGIKTWTRDEVITTDKPYDGLYLGDVTPSDAVTETLIYLPENDSGSVKLVPFIVLSVNYLGGVYVMREPLSESMKATWGGSFYYPGNPVDSFLSATYLNSILDKSISDALLTCSVPVQTKSSTAAVETMDRKCWVPSYGELYDAAFNDGTKMPYFNSTNRIAYINGGNVKGAYWTRTRAKGGSPYSVNTSGGMSNAYGWSDTIYIRPSFVLPKDFKIQRRPDGSYTVWNGQGLMKLGDIEASTDSFLTKINIGEDTGIYVFDYLTDNYSESGRALLYRENVLTNRFSTSANYTNSGLKNAIVSWEAALPESLRLLINGITIKYRDSYDSTAFTASIKETTERAFALSLDDMFGDSTHLGTGNILPAFSVPENRKRKDKAGAVSYWTRDGYDGCEAYGISASGSWSQINTGAMAFAAPAITLPIDSPIRALPDDTYDLVPDDPALENLVQTFAPDTPATPEETDYVTHTVEVPHGQKVVFRQFTQNQKKQFQTMLVGGVYPPPGDVEPPFALPEFTGNHMIYGDEIEGRIELLESGDLTLSPGVYDIFAVGGGSSGLTGGSTNSYNGGSSGYTKTLKGVKVSEKIVCEVLIGAGGNQTGTTDASTVLSNNGTSTSIRHSIFEDGILEANGGTSTSGGSGGGVVKGGIGGSDGSNGKNSAGTPLGSPVGQGTTTRAFEESGNTLYSAGGGAGYRENQYIANGGDPGGGNGAWYSTSTKNGYGSTATPNTGSGGGGGLSAAEHRYPGMAGASGIAIVRWNNTAS